MPMPRRVPDKMLRDFCRFEMISVDFDARREAYRATGVGEANVKSRNHGALGKTDGENGDSLQRCD
jgi:hypothetical protein